MAMLDFGVITIKNNKLLEETEGIGWLVKQGAGGEFLHQPSGVVFYKTSIKDDLDVEKATVRVYMSDELSYLKKKVNYLEINGLSIKTKEICDGTYLSEFKDGNGDRYKVIFGFDVGFKYYWKKKNGDAIKKILKQYTGRTTLK